MYREQVEEKNYGRYTKATDKQFQRILACQNGKDTVKEILYYQELVKNYKKTVDSHLGAIRD